jgi:phosphoribosylformylglycinamidine synthase subunit PurL
MLTENRITPEIVAQHNLSEEEYQRIVRFLGRQPNFTELGIFSVMWSEHCCYKSSKAHLKRLPTSGDRVLQGPGENAGIIDIGDNYAIAFKIESHNHPSFIEPFQGAATGVGGILRDIFTMGARPIAAMNSLRFGPLEEARNRNIMEGVVAGIASYGNCFGVPTVGGEVVFEECYSQNPLVNAFALGLFKKDRIFYAKATGVGNPVIYVGSKTGRDGIHGATMASSEFDTESESKRPNVQVGDPFTEKLLLEACLEAMKTGAVVGVQDMGAAGLTCSTCEMGSRAGTGVEIDLQFVPQRETGMTPYEIMLSESQERMLLIIESGREEDVFQVFRKWGLDVAVIGRVTTDGFLRIKNHGTVVAEIPNSALTDGAPVYHRPIQKPEVNPVKAPFGRDGSVRRSTITEGARAENSPTLSRSQMDFGFLLRQFLSSPNLASKEWVYRQYDHMVRTNTVQLPSADAAVIRIKGTDKALGLTLDGNGRYCRHDPRRGAQIAVAESCRNLVCVGARPMAATNCLNFGNPEKPEIMWQFSEVIDGMAEACKIFETPVTGGNVSFYNETLGQGIYPTPVVGMVGLIQPLSHMTSSWFMKEGHLIVLCGELAEREGDYSQAVVQTLTEFWDDRTSCSDFYTQWVNLLPCPPLDLDHEVRVQRTCLEAIQAGLIVSAHDCSDGGLATALAEMAFSHFRKSALGAQIEIVGDVPGENILFGEYQSRILVTLQEEDLWALQAIARKHSVSILPLGKVGGSCLTITIGDSLGLNVEVSVLEEIWRDSLSRFFRNSL